MSLRLFRLLLPLAAALVVPAAADAQGARYATEPGDTLRYGQRVRVNVSFSMMGSSQDVDVELDGRVRVAFLPGDSAEAVYEEVRARQRMNGQERPAEDMEEMEVPVRFPFGPLGPPPRAGMVMGGMPNPGGNIMGEGDFADFFVRLPGGGLAPGTTWADTVQAGSSAATIVRTYRVTGDTTVAGARLAVIDIRMPMQVELTEREDGTVTHMRLSGEETGTALFDAARGALVRMARTGRVEAKIAVDNGGMNLSIPMTMAWTLASELQPR